MEDQGWYECRVLFLDQHSPEQDFANGSWVHLTVNCMKLGEQVVQGGRGVMGTPVVKEKRELCLSQRMADALPTLASAHCSLM